MAKRKKEESHENLERWMVSYADFMTLLFATFVVLYALAQIDIKEFDKLQESIKAAFNNSPISGGQHLMDGVGVNVINQNGAADNNSVIPPLMEYISQKYEKNSMEDIKRSIEKVLKDSEIEGVSAEITDRGLVITLKDTNTFFQSGSAQLTSKAQQVLNAIGGIIKKKFNKHLIRIEGHTDNMPLNPGSIYPSNWELSGARAAVVARFLISKYNITPNLVTIIGYGDTRPLDDNSTPAGREKNRRVEIVILKNQMAKYEPQGAEIIAPHNELPNKITQIKQNGLSDAAKELLKDEKDVDDVIILDEYNKPKNRTVKQAISDFETNKQKEKKKIKSSFH